MLTSSVTETEARSASTLTGKTPGLGQEDFLRMLIAQLENQDPLNPQESTEFTAQLAQFSSLEQEIAMRQSLGEISAAMGRSDSVTAIGMIGQEVLIETPYFQLEAGGAELEFDLSSATDSTLIDVQDEKGRVVATIDLGAQEAGMNSHTWDGVGKSGQPLKAGVYGLSVHGLADGSPVETTALVRARVSGADVAGSMPMLLMGNLIAPLSGVREVRAIESAEASP